MSDLAREYVKQLGRDRVTRAQKYFLFVLADYHNAEKNYAWPSLPTLAEDNLMSVRQVRRLLHDLRHIIQCVPGIGRGNLSVYRFLELDDFAKNVPFFIEKRGAKGDKKRDISASPIRKENQNREPNQNPPYPPLGGLTPRQLASFSKELDRIYAANQGRKLSHDEVVQAACARLVLPLECARAAIAASFGSPNTNQQGEPSSPDPQKPGQEVA